MEFHVSYNDNILLNLIKAIGVLQNISYIFQWELLIISGKTECCLYSSAEQRVCPFLHWGSKMPNEEVNTGQEHEKNFK